MKLITFPPPPERTDEEVENKLDDIFKRLFRCQSIDENDLEMKRKLIIKHSERDSVIDCLDELSDLIGQPDNEITRAIIKEINKQLLELKSPLYIQASIEIEHQYNLIKEWFEEHPEEMEKHHEFYSKLQNQYLEITANPTSAENINKYYEMDEYFYQNIYKKSEYYDEEFLNNICNLLTKEE